jgi:rhodanese-related sulfurtransferase
MSYDNVPAAHWEKWTAENSAVILDVREPSEWKLGTLPNAELISMREIPTRIEELDKTIPVLCVCRSGARSGQVAAFLAMRGFSGVANMAGGMKALGMQT